MGLRGGAQMMFHPHWHLNLTRRHLNTLLLQSQRQGQGPLVVKGQGTPMLVAVLLLQSQRQGQCPLVVNGQGTPMLVAVLIQ